MMSIQSHTHCGTIQLCVLAERDQLRADKAELLATLKYVVRPHRQFVDMVDNRATDEAHRIIAKHEAKS